MTGRNTIQKELVLNAVKRLKCHATADEVYNFIIREHPSIGKATVYRNLNLLSENGEIRKLQIPGEPDRFDHNVGLHQHVKCIKCGKIFDVSVENLPDLSKQIKDNHGIEILNFNVTFEGICPDCK